MLGRRNYIVPFWSLLTLTVIRFTLSAYMVYTLGQREYVQPFLRSYIRNEIIFLLVLVAETVAYWYMRKLSYRRSMALLHVGFWYVALILLPMIQVGVQVYIHQAYEGQQQRPPSFKSAFDTIYWVIVVVGHLFFAIAIVQAIRNKRKEKALGISQIFESI